MKIATPIGGILLLLSSLMFISCSEENIEKNTEPTDDGTTPNIILIIADDMGWDVYGDYPGTADTKAHTPTLDSLSRNGLTFLNFWSYPVCAPTRAAMLTGKYGFRTGVGGTQNPQTATLGSTETIIQNHVGMEKYATAVIGKWHVSPGSQLDAPESFGVDYYSGILRGSVTDYFDWVQTSGGIQENVKTYTTTHFTDLSIDWIHKQSQPFFLWLAFNAPHTPFHRPPLNLISNQSLADDEATINANPLPYFLASIEAMDREISRLINSLSPAQKENTLFIFLSDNGTPPKVGQDPYIDNGVKNTLFQGGINTPMIVCGKGVSRAGEDETALVQSTDLFATILDVGGSGGIDYGDGVSFKGLLSDANSPKRAFSYTEQFGNSSSAKDGYTIRDQHYKLIHLETGTEYYYHLSSDPFETSNLLSGTLSNQEQQSLDQLRALKIGLE